MSGNAEQRELERGIFERFLSVASEFRAAISGEWTQPTDDPPDVRFRDTDSRLVGVELKAWINEEQIAEGKRREALEERFLTALRPQSANPLKVVSYVWLRPAGNQAPAGAEAVTFKDELLSLLAAHDATWSAQGHEIVQGETLTQLQQHPTLARHLAAVVVFPRTIIDPKGQDWIGFPFRGGPYAEQDMLRPLQDLIAGTRIKYETTKADKELDRLILLIHYDGRAWQYNSPIEAPDWDLSVFANEAAYMVFALDTLSEEPSTWDEVFLFDAVGPCRSQSIRVREASPTSTPAAL